MTPRGRLLGPYYLLTPVFLLLDLVWDANIRVVALEAFPLLRYGYYALCLGLGVLIRRWPDLASPIAAAESGVNLLLLVLGVLVAYGQALAALGEGRTVANPFTVPVLVNFVLSGAVALVVFYRHEPGRAPASRRRPR